MSEVNWRRHKAALKIIIVLNLLDACATIIWVESGLAYEANPLMRYLLDISPALFLFFKLLLVNLGISLLWIYRENTFARHVTIPVTAVYMGIGVYHLVHAIIL